MNQSIRCSKTGRVGNISKQIQVKTCTFCKGSDRLGLPVITFLALLFLTFTNNKSPNVNKTTILLIDDLIFKTKQCMTKVGSIFNTFWVTSILFLFQ